MPSTNTLEERYRPLNSSYSETPVLVIDTEADPYEILDAARQRIRAANDLLETLYCLCFKQADASDIPKIISALYLLTQDGNDLLDIARQRLPRNTDSRISTSSHCEPACNER
ncbi:hypothetical protein [Pseudomonas vancouverensis]|uniref:DUF3077 domain-containing protein n=1 Tax=Pseudomonas vancouverensis TaxID=95300 RepID=A0A1H2PCB9_PSEVA|nr:hypothetical protein [Pseudomonas vancouverensis]KAB0493708.1 hypothetical protein F7R09_21925 [Pseudomonas vancouverensis]TDB67715.1 hypothetical protein EIY72_02945 [Pseudomonas vancouverensis]SDV15322.1 hypothetical protein SAMN05216558_4892 [Pseudomonas vancouverensis]